MKHLDDLMKRFLNGTASEKEKVELAQLVRSKGYEEYVDRKVHEVSSSELPEEPQNNKNHEQMFREILQKKSSKVIPLYKRRVFQVAASLAFLALLLTYFNSSLLNVNQLEHVTSTPGKKEFVRFPDGSYALLNAGSTVTYYENFGAASREVKLIGEAYFNVKPDPERPFIVHSGEVSVKVLGTSFNVNAYPSKKQVTVTVTHGLVEVSAGNQVFGKLTPDQELVVEIPAFTFDVKKVKAEEALEWKSNFMVFDKIRLEDAAQMISERYGVDVQFENPLIKECEIEGAFFNDETLSHVLSSVSTVMNLKYTLKDKTVIFEGEGCSPRTP